MLKIHFKSREKLPEDLNYPEDVNKYFSANTYQVVKADKEILKLFETNHKVQIDKLFKFEYISENTVNKILLEIKSIYCECVVPKSFLICPIY